LTQDSALFWTNSQTFAGLAADPDSFYARRTALVSQLVCRHARGTRALDLGCGDGRLCLDLAGRGFDVHGIDISEPQIIRTIERARDLVDAPERRFKVGDALDTSFAGTFDVITAIGLLPYIENRAAFMARLVAQLTPDGILIISGTNRVSLFTLLELMRHVRGFKWNAAWFAVLRNLARTGIWSGGLVGVAAARQCRSAAALDRMCHRFGLRAEATLDLYNIDGCRLDRSAFTRSRFGRILARYLGWSHIGVYRVDDSGHGTQG
jgi:SAM-dependent methyltransferase